MYDLSENDADLACAALTFLEHFHHEDFLEYLKYHGHDDTADYATIENMEWAAYKLRHPGED